MGTLTIITRQSAASAKCAHKLRVTRPVHRRSPTNFPGVKADAPLGERRRRSVFRKRLDAQTELAFSDPLTGLGNVRALQEALEDACEQGAPLTMLYLDIDDFERVNDERGRVVGDRLLQRVAAAVRAELREGDVAVRLGGDELGVVMPATDYAQASQVLARLRSLRPSLHDEPLGVTLSLGAVTFLRPPTDPRRVVAMADRAMYSSKRAGGATVTHELVSAAFVTAPMDPSAAE
jgi:diguanylate cyclase (GGDEF)-like protein